MFFGTTELLEKQMKDIMTILMENINVFTYLDIMGRVSSISIDTKDYLIKEMKFIDIDINTDEDNIFTSSLKRSIDSLNKTYALLYYKWLNKQLKQYNDDKTKLIAMNEKYEDIKQDLEKTEQIYLSIIKRKENDIQQSKEEISQNNNELTKLSKKNNLNKKNEILQLNKKLKLQIEIFETDIKTLQTLIDNLKI